MKTLRFRVLLSAVFLSFLVTIAAFGAAQQTAAPTPSGDPMMDQMMRDPAAMQKMMNSMMADPKSRQAMIDAMAKNPEMMTMMMTRMMSSPDHCRLMAEQMARDPNACRNMMKAMSSRMKPAAEKDMMSMCSGMMQSSTRPAAAAARSKKSDEHTIDVGSEFSPSTIKVKKGVPVTLKFRRSGKPTCATSVTFPDLGITRELPDNQTTAIEITPSKSGPLTFSCGAGMLHGKLVVE